MKKIIMACVTGCIFSCSTSTKIVKSWKEPGATLTQSAATKILVVAFVKDETTRRIAEDEVVQRLSVKNSASASYNLITADALKKADVDELAGHLKQGQFTNILLMRLVDVEKETSYVPGTTTAFYGGYRRYYGYGSGFYTTPGYYTTNKNYFVETAVYSIDPDKLLWTATSKTVNPSKLENTVKEIGDAVSARMKKEGFIK